MEIKEIKFDKFGPEYVINVYDPKIGMKGILVIDSTVLGPGKGGIRMTPDVDAEQTKELKNIAIKIKRKKAKHRYLKNWKNRFWEELKKKKN